MSTRNAYVKFKLNHRAGEAMSPEYLFLCGVMWAKHASVDAYKELLRALRSDDPGVVLLASALIDQRAPQLRFTVLHSRDQ